MLFELNAERGAAAAGRLGIRVVEDEPLAVQPSRVLQRGASEKNVRLTVYEELHAVLFYHLVSLVGLLDHIKNVGEARAASTLYSYSQVRFGHVTLLGELADMIHGILGYRNCEGFGLLFDRRQTLFTPSQMIVSSPQDCIDARVEKSMN